MQRGGCATKEEILQIAGKSIRAYFYNTVVVGTGAAGYNAALRLWRLGQSDIAMVTEGVNCGTSRNTGSDKQTYYKLNLSGDIADSPADMARDLFKGRCVDGDHAYAEAAQSVQCFLNLAEVGVQFPVNRYGEYVGYKTDHDPRARATSVGPLTSKLMTECLQKEVERAGVRVHDRMLVVSILKMRDERVAGVLALDLDHVADDGRFVLYAAKNVVWATGGPAGIYADSVYPLGHTGCSGVAFEAGAKGKNLTEWQYGLASVAPRWNVSGTYMQVLPRFVSVDPDGTEHEFLSEYFTEMGECLSWIFLKGYQWPFDAAKAMEGSSLVDLLVYRETALFGRRVYLDFRRNPGGLDELPYDALSPEARTYLESAGACFGTPIERLLHMNEPAYTLYLSKGLDLKKEPLEIALCAQHNNGGIDVDLWWQTALPGLFACGETAGTHGVTRPGGSALNAGQVGSLRAARYIAARGQGDPVSVEELVLLAAEPLKRHREIVDALLSGGDNASDYILEYSTKMSRVAGAIRNSDAIEEMLSEVSALLSAFPERVRVSADDLASGYRLRDLLLTQLCYLSAMRDYVREGGRSRGSSIYSAEDGKAPDGLEPLFAFVRDDGHLDGSVEITALTEKDGVLLTENRFRSVRPLPEGGGFFENVWRQYRSDGNIF